ncbi:hypothetical protein BH10ACT11_BH10ACT11_12830 [soil metagenome]
MWLSKARPGDTIAPPAIFHVTHYKAGSQWILKILTECVDRDRFVAPREGVAHFLGANLWPGAVYPTVYVTKEEFDAADLPPEWSRFVVIRDLRDTMVSLYFSLRYSHPEGFSSVGAMRPQLEALDEREGLTLVMRRSVRRSAAIQRSWIEAGEHVIRYEDLIDNDIEILEEALLSDERLEIDPGRLRKAIERSRFRRMSGGRLRGEEDLSAHLRRGTPGEWRERLDDEQIAEFKELYGNILIASGYERDLEW